MTGPVAIGIDIGGTKIAAGLVDRDGLAGELQVVPTDADAGGSAVLQRALDLGRSVVERLPGASGATAIGVAAGGWIDAAGRVIGATALLPGWAGIDLRAAFERELGIRATVVNDGQAMGVAEARLGAGRECGICLCIAVGTGIGGAITVDGRLFGGARGFAGAIGHIGRGRSGPRCSCGGHGCIEAEASGPAIARAFDSCLRRAAVRGFKAAGRSALRDVVLALESSDEAAHACALDVTRKAGSRLGRVLGGLANALDPDVIIVGGGAAAALGDHFLAAIRSGVAEAILAQIKVAVVPSRLGGSASVVGAGLLALDGVNGTPGDS